MNEYVNCFRSYYRCTTATCNVKKRVERSYSDPSVVVTTYEGQHIHPSPLLSTRPSQMPMQMTRTLSRSHPHLQPPFIETDRFNFGSYQAPSSANNTLLHERRLCNHPSPSLLAGHGLLQDIIPSHMLKQE